MLASRLSLLLLLAACGGKTVELDDGGTTDGGNHPDAIISDVVVPPADAFPPPTDGSPISCNNVDPGTKTIAIVASSGTPPPLASMGGTIQPGLYELTDLTVYGTTVPASTITAQMRANVTNSGYVFDIGSASDNQAPTHTTETAQLLGPTNMNIQETCPGSPQTYKANFAVNQTSLVIRIMQSGVTVDESFTFIGP